MPVHYINKSQGNILFPAMNVFCNIKFTKLLPISTVTRYTIEKKLWLPLAQPFVK
jgi:hypothetical protein